ncbi:MAG: hypothetical protein KDE47_25945 [Caldilineaceae bacterium]|nr:hypothetical protein [Caldilineaceae bacterium]
MNYWHEPRSKERTVVVTSESGLIRVCLRFNVDDKSQYQLYASIWEGDGEPHPWHIAPERWVELWPHVPIYTESLLKSNQLLKNFLKKLENKIPYDEFERREPHLERVQVISHANGRYQAWIYAYRDGRYEVQYYTWTDGRGGGWIQIRYEICTFANSLQHAQEIAQLEMEELANEDT